MDTCGDLVRLTDEGKGGDGEVTLEFRPDELTDETERSILVEKFT